MKKKTKIINDDDDDDDDDDVGFKLEGENFVISISNFTFGFILGALLVWIL